MRIHLLSIVLFGVMSTRAAAEEPTVSIASGPSATVSPTAEGPKRLSAAFAFTNSVGTGTFVQDEFSDDPYFGQSLGLKPKYKLTENLSLSASWTLAWELTTPSNAFSVDTSTGRRYSPSDVGFTLSHASLYEDARHTGVKVNGSLAAIVPTSFESRFRHTITNVTTTLGATRKFLGDKLSVGYSFAFKKYFPARETKGFITDPDQQAEVRDDHGNLLVSCSASRDICAGSAGINPNFAIKNSFSVGYDWTDKLSTSLDLGIQNFFKFKVDGPYTDPNLPSRGRSDETTGTVDISYALTDMFSLSAGVTSRQPALDEQNDDIRFPFFDFESPSNNYTEFYVSGSATL